MIYTVTFNPAIDYVVQLPDPLALGEVNRAAAEDYQFGGKGINVACILHTLGCPATALGFVAGPTGRWLEQGLRDKGLATDFIPAAQGLTRINLKIHAGNQETELNGIGPQIGPEEMARLEAQLDKLAAGDALVLAGSIPACLPADSYERLMDRLAGRGVLIAVDASGELLARVLRCRPFLIKPNHHELAEILGRELHGDEEIAAGAAELQAKGARNVLVSMAGEGALLLDETGRTHRAKAPHGKVINSVGAGDSMLAGFLAGWLQTGDYAQALRLGSAAGSATAFSLGLASREKIQELLAEV